METENKTIKLLARAKINLSLDIVGRRADGYHLMDMVMRSVDLSDELTLHLRESGGINLSSNARYLPRDGRNLVVKAVSRLCERVGIEPPSLDIHIKKRIPAQAGLGGGSADAAAALIGVNSLLSLGLGKEELCSTGESVGADVPFCLIGGAARVGGIGELVRSVPDRCDYVVLILMPARGRSTVEAFARFDKGAVFKRPDTEALLAALASGDTAAMGIHLENAFCSLESGGESERLKSLLLRNEALGASMSGSGAAVFGIYSDIFSAQRAKRALEGEAAGAYIARPCAEGVKIISV
ncbi:MAG: 4-(cytidine 5'-diphospho)-2-C-methyl-D-erythritol kinase [Oscillospiraceae bacterium]|nr:4-(cytidine 5'-diphospho)-2-C-methyl-D-erythritol kinase [Oscillospiraceae bacterium]